MKTFVHRLSWFLLFSAVLNVLIVLFVVLLNRHAVNNCELDDNVTAVIIGDSHTMWSIDAKNIKNVENVSLNAEGYIYTYYKLKYLLNEEPNITHVYLGFGYHNLSGYYDEYISGFQFKNLIHRYIGVMSLGDFMEVIVRNPKDIPTVFRNILQRGGVAGLKQRCTLYGSFPSEKKLEVFDSSQMHKRILEQFYDDGKVIGISDSNLEYLDKIVALGRESGVEITLLSTPLHKDYSASIPAEFKTLYHEYTTQNHLKVYAFEDLALTDSDFLPDGDHVNYSGAMLTTEKFRDYHEDIIE